jgi:hypothetical protein
MFASKLLDKKTCDTILIKKNEKKVGQWLRCYVNN